jgi:hypothetical protein
MSEHRRYLDEPFVTEILAIERIQAELRILARYDLTPLPQRLRSRFAGMFSRLHRIKRELEQDPTGIASEREAEDARGNP